MSDRHTADTITPDALDQLYAERDMLGRETDRLRKDWVEMRGRAERAEAANERVRTIAGRWAQYGSNELRTAARVLHIEGLAEQSAAVGQQPTTDAPFGDRHGPTPEEVRAGRAGLFTVFGPPVSCPHCGPEAAPVPSTHWTKHVQRHHPEQQPTT